MELIARPKPGDYPAYYGAYLLATTGEDLVDALHHASDRNCDGMASFDDRKFARRVKRMGLVPTVTVPS